MKQEAARRRKQGCSPSAISRYLGSDATLVALPRLFSHRFNPLYRGTWFPTFLISTIDIRSIRFNPLYRGTWFPTAATTTASPTRCTVSIRYIAVLGFQQVARVIADGAAVPVSIRYIAVLGFQRQVEKHCPGLRISFNPLYRGTWFPTL